jgi:hypothetical protein
MLTMNLRQGNWRLGLALIAAGLAVFVIVPFLMTTDDSPLGLTVWFLGSGVLVPAGLLTGIGPADVRTYGILALAGVGLFLVSVVAHNIIAALTGIDEAVFFSLALPGAPVLVITGLAGLAWAAIRGHR